MQRLAEQIRKRLDAWQALGQPGRDGYLAAADEIRNWRTVRGIAGLWPRPPLMVTATLDDAMGHGLIVIETFAVAAGLEVLPMGLLQPAEKIVALCREREPDLLGLTVLQFDTEPELAALCRDLTPGTRVTAGGPVFGADSDLASRVGLDATLRHAADFWDYLLAFELAGDRFVDRGAAP